MTEETTVRLCTHNNRMCSCSDAEAQPCMAALIDKYLDALRWSVLTDGADGGPGDALEVSESRRNIAIAARSFASPAEFIERRSSRSAWWRHQ
jgi:hypothetical protein